MFSPILTVTCIHALVAQSNAATSPLKNSYLPSVTDASNMTNHTYEVILEQYNSSNCSVPYHNFTYVFNCTGLHNKTWCCADEYAKLNTSFGNAECNRYESNDTYVHFQCQDYSGSASKKMNPYVVAAIAVGITVGFAILIFLLVKCMLGCNRTRYNKL